MSPRVLHLVVVAALSLAAPVPGDPPAPLTHFAVVGASASSGYRTPIDLADAIAASLVRAPERGEAHATELFFTAPAGYAEAQLQAALEGEPQVLYALDFLFWFGYGSADSEGLPLSSEGDRLELLEEGLEYLAEVECTLVVGDFPDMSAAVGRMLWPAQMPALETLVLLNARLREWAAERERTVVVDLSDFLARTRKGQAFEFGARRFEAERIARLMQDDELHPTREGLLALAQVCADALIERELVRPEDFDLGTPAMLDRLAEREE